MLEGNQSCSWDEVKEGGRWTCPRSHRGGKPAFFLLSVCFQSFALLPCFSLRCVLTPFTSQEAGSPACRSLWAHWRTFRLWAYHRTPPQRIYSNGLAWFQFQNNPHLFDAGPSAAPQFSLCVRQAASKPALIGCPSLRGVCRSPGSFYKPCLTWTSAFAAGCDMSDRNEGKVHFRGSASVWEPPQRWKYE